MHSFSFHAQARGSSTFQEIRAGLTTFLAMAYIIAVNPAVLVIAGVPITAAITATCASAGLSSIIMGFVSNRPLALAPGMGLNAIVATSITAAAGGDWHAAMACVFIEGICLFLLVVFGLREAVIRAIPKSLRHALAAGLGLFLALIGLINAQLVVSNEATVVAFGDIHNPSLIVGLISLIATFILHIKRVPGDIILGIIIAVVAGIFLGTTPLPTGVFSLPDSSSFFAPFLLDSKGVMGICKVVLSPVLLTFVFALIMTDFFDTVGTALAVAKQGDFLSKDGEIENLKEILISDSIAATLGGFLGASSLTVYLESSAGAADGGRTGLTAIVTGVLFLVAMFFAPLVTCVTSAATAGALVLVGFLMMDQVLKIDWQDPLVGIPSFLIMVGIPMTYSIATGLGLGFISYVILALVTKKVKRVHPLLWVVAGLFLLSFIIV